MATESQPTPPGEGVDLSPEDDGQEPGVGQSFIDQLRARRAAIATETTRQFELPGYEGLLTVTYRRMEYKEVAPIIKRVVLSDDIQKEMDAQVDFLIRACVSIDAVDGTHVSNGFDPELAEYFGFESARARECLYQVFSNTLAISSHQGAVLRWMQQGEHETAEEFQGE